VPDASKFDLGQQVSLAASQAVLCLTDARGGPKRIRQPALGLYVNACAGLADPNLSIERLNNAMEQVVKLAPDFPRGWSSLSLGRAIIVESEIQRGGKPNPASLKAALEAIATARKMDPRSGLSYLAEWHLKLMDPLLGIPLLDKAVEVAPDEPIVQARRSTVLQAVGRMSDAIAAAHRATELDPLWSFLRATYIDSLAYSGQFSRANAEIADAHRKWPLNAEIDQADFQFQFSYGEPRLAEQLLPKVLDLGDAQLAPYHKFLTARLDPTAAKINDAIESLREAESTDPRARNTELLALGLFGKSDDAYALISDATFRPRLDLALLFRPELAGVRADPRFMQVAARLGLVSYWHKSGKWPDFCTSEKLRYDCKAEAGKYGT
jgi:tetratricopeptide (TPR) repeat protein